MRSPTTNDAVSGVALIPIGWRSCGIKYGFVKSKLIHRGNRLGKRDVSLYAKRRNQKSNQTRSWHRVHPRGRSAHATERLSEDSILRMAKSQQSHRQRRSSLAGDAVPRSCVLFMGIHQVTPVGWTSLQRLRRKPANDFGDRPRRSSVVPKRARLPR